MDAIEKINSNNGPCFSILTFSTDGEIELSGIRPVAGNVQTVQVTKSPAYNDFNFKEPTHLRNAIAFEPAVFKFAGTHFLRLIYPSHYFW